MQKSQEEGLIKLNPKVVFLLLILAMIALAMSILPGADPSHKNNDKTSLDYDNTSIVQRMIPASNNTTNNTRTGHISIPLEKPPFID